MTTPQTTARVAPRRRNKQATLLTAIGVLVAIAVSIGILALTRAHQTNTTTTTTIPVTASGATDGSVPQSDYLGPRRMRATVLHYTCRLGAAQAQARCLP